MPSQNAEILNPGGFDLNEAIRSLHHTGYSDSAIERLIEVIGIDRWGKPVWKWRTEDSRPSPARGLRIQTMV